MVQNVWLGLMAAAVVGVQFTIIPRLRRELLRLGKQRQIASRRLAGRVGEVVGRHRGRACPQRRRLGARRDRQPPLRALRPALPHLQAEVHGQVPEQPARADDAVLLLRGRRLFRAARAARHRPARRGDRRLSRAAAAVEGADRLGPAAPRRAGQVRSGRPAFLAGAPRCRTRRPPRRGRPRSSGRSWPRTCASRDPHGGVDLDGVSLDLPVAGASRRSSPTARGGERLRAHRRRAARSTTPARCESAGTISPACPRRSAGRRSPMRASSRSCSRARIRDNLVYGLRHRPLGEPRGGRARAARRLAEAKRTGNPVESIHDRLDRLSLAGADRRGRARPHPDRPPEAGRHAATTSIASASPAWSIPSAPGACRAHRRGAHAPARQARAVGMADLVEPFDPRALQRPGDGRREPAVRRADLARADGPQPRRACRLPRRPRSPRPDRRPRRHGRRRSPRR